MESPQTTSDTGRAAAILTDLLRARNAALGGKFPNPTLMSPAETSPAPNVTFDAILVTLIIELTEFRGAVNFFGPSIPNETQKSGLGGDLISPTTRILLAHKCYEEYKTKARENDTTLPGLSYEDCQDMFARVRSPPPSEQQVQHALVEFINLISTPCLLQIKKWWTEYRPNVHLEVPQIRHNPSASGSRNTTKLSTPRSLGSPSKSLSSLQFGMADQKIGAQSHLIYETPTRASPVTPTGSPALGLSRLASSSPSLALSILDSQEPIDPKSLYATQIAQSLSTYLDRDRAISSEADSAFSDRDCRCEAETSTSATALSAADTGGLGLVKTAGGMVNAVMRRVGRSPTPSAKGAKSRETSATRSDAAKLRLQRPILIDTASISPARITPDGKGFYSDQGVGVPAKEEPLIGMLKNLGSLSRSKLLSKKTWDTIGDHAGICAFRFHRHSPAIINNNESSATATAGAIVVSFQETSDLSGTFVFTVVCGHPQHSTLKCTQEPSSLHYPVDLGPFLKSIEGHSADRAKQMAQSMAEQFIAKADAEAALAVEETSESGPA